MQQTTVLIIDGCRGTSTGTLSRLRDLADSSGGPYRMEQTTIEVPMPYTTYEFQELQEPVPIIKPKPVYSHWRKRQDRHRFHKSKWSVGG